ncbi:DUF916 domain-containing protein [Vagococcus acidifermentans]|uniref:Uncharacterized protein n=1 Tax=Vagococcus acidifermentans TaxID=564710 RepID=A0A430B2T0_9ENTE|nr:DUF916 domain-containing protein [Vagococcus acidifermentans]RSU14647.1 hypothetical protein CBF27_01290 [Vagococcus acidifermentans]
MKKRSVLLFLTMLCQLLACFSGTIHNAESEGGYAVSPIFSEHQKEGVLEFFDIRWTPGGTDTFGIRIVNKSENDQTYIVSLNKARTNSNGVIDYSTPADKSTAETGAIHQFVTIPEEIVVAANSSEVVEGTVSFPDEDFNGLVMGGVNISEKKIDNAGKGVTNIVSYTFPIVLRGNIDERPEPVITLEKLSIEPVTSDSHALHIALNNHGPNLLKDVAVTVNLSDQNGQVKESRESSLDMTPATEFIYPVELTGKLAEGDYYVTVKLVHSSGQEWTFDDTLTISGKQAKELAKSTPGNGLPLQYFIPIAVIGLLAGWFLLKKNRRHDSSNQ